MDRGFTLIVLAVLAGAAKVILSWTNVSHWLNTACDMASHNPITLPLAWFTWGVFGYSVWINGFKLETLYLWFLVVIGLAVNWYFTGCMIGYWFS